MSDPLKYNEEVYKRAVHDLACQIFAMVVEDEGDDFMLEEYLFDAIQDVQDAVGAIKREVKKRRK